MQNEVMLFSNQKLYWMLYVFAGCHQEGRLVLMTSRFQWGSQLNHVYLEKRQLKQWMALSGKENNSIYFIIQSQANSNNSNNIEFI